MRRVRRPGRQVLERLPEVRCRVRLVLLLRLLCRLFRLRGIDLQGVRAPRLRAQDRHGVVELLWPFATLAAHPAGRRAGPSRGAAGAWRRGPAWAGRARGWSTSAIARKAHSRAPNAFRSWMAL